VAGLPDNHRRMRQGVLLLRCRTRAVPSAAAQAIPFSGKCVSLRNSAIRKFSFLGNGKFLRRSDGAKDAFFGIATGVPMCREFAACGSLLRTRVTSPRHCGSNRAAAEDLRPRSPAVQSVRPGCCVRCSGLIRAKSIWKRFAMMRGQTADCHHHGHHRGFPGETESDFEENHQPAPGSAVHRLFAFKYSPRPIPPALNERRDSRRGEGRGLPFVQEKQREIQAPGMRRLAGQTFEVLVSGKSRASTSVSTHIAPHDKFRLHKRENFWNLRAVRVTGAGP